MSGTRARETRTGKRAPLRGKEAFEARLDDDPKVKSDWRRNDPANDRDVIDITQVVEAVFGNPDLYRLAEMIPKRSKIKPGCPADYPTWALVGYGVLIRAYSSSRKTHAAMRVQRNWEHVLEVVARTAGQATVDALRPVVKARRQGPDRNHWNYWSRVNKQYCETVEELYLPLAVAQAKEQGLLDPNVDVTYGSPDQSHTIYGDGKVMKSPVRYRGGLTIDGTTGEVLRAGRPTRTDPASAMWIQGGDEGQDVYGPKFVFTSVRGSGWLNSVCLTVSRQVKGGPGEAEIAMTQARRIMEAAVDGVHAHAWDGALSHVNIQELMREHGLVAISPVKAKSNPDGIRSGKKHPSRVEKDHEYETVKYRTDNGPCQHNLHTLGGRLGETVIDGTGTKTWVPLPIDALERRGTVGAYRWYHRVRIECDLNGDHPMRLPLVQSQADTDTGFLRSEYLRQLPPDTKGYARAYGSRPPAEGDNSRRENGYTWNRIAAYGGEQQFMLMFLGNFLDNSRARWAHQRRQAEAGPDAVQNQAA